MFAHIITHYLCHPLGFHHSEMGGSIAGVGSGVGACSPDDSPDVHGLRDPLGTTVALGYVLRGTVVLGVVDPPGMRSTWPTRIRLADFRPLTRINVRVETPQRRAIAESVSPLRTVYHDPHARAETCESC